MVSLLLISPAFLTAVNASFCGDSLSLRLRFRVEIGFSPGATATPLHMSERSRDGDSSRFDTAKLQTISKEMLTCDELESYFIESIKHGYSPDSEDERRMRKEKKKGEQAETESVASRVSEGSRESSPRKGWEGGERLNAGKAGKGLAAGGGAGPPQMPSLLGLEGGAGAETPKTNRKKAERWKRLGRRWLWGGMAGLSLGLGMGCFLLARRMKGGGWRIRK